MAASKKTVNFSHNKYLVVLLLIILPVLGVYFGMKYQAKRQAVTNIKNEQLKPVVRKDTPQSLIRRCGSLPVAPGASGFVVTQGVVWSPDCRYVAWSVRNSGTVVMNPDGSGSGVKGNGEEGIYIYTDATKQTRKIELPERYNNTLEFVEWLDGSSFVFIYSPDNGGERNRAVYSVISNQVKSE